MNMPRNGEATMPMVAAATTGPVHIGPVQDSAPLARQRLHNHATQREPGYFAQPLETV